MGTETARALGAVVRERRRALGLTQEGLAERAGLSQKHVARIERAERLPTVHAAILLGRGLGVSGSDLVREAEEAAVGRSAKGETRSNKPSRAEDDPELRQG